MLDTLFFMCWGSTHLGKNCYAQGLCMSTLFFHFYRYWSQACHKRGLLSYPAANLKLFRALKCKLFGGRWAVHRLCLYAHFWVKLPIEENDLEDENTLAAPTVSSQNKMRWHKDYFPLFFSTISSFMTVLPFFLAFLPNSLFPFLWTCGLRTGLTG